MIQSGPLSQVLLLRGCPSGQSLGLARPNAAASRPLSERAVDWPSDDRNINSVHLQTCARSPMAAGCKLDKLDKLATGGWQRVAQTSGSCGHWLMIVIIIIKTVIAYSHNNDGNNNQQNNNSPAGIEIFFPIPGSVRPADSDWMQTINLQISFSPSFPPHYFACPPPSLPPPPPPLPAHLIPCLSSSLLVSLSLLPVSCRPIAFFCCPIARSNLARRHR